MPPTVAATNVIGEFQEDVKSPWGQRVHGGDQMVIGVPRAVKAQVATGGNKVTTAQRIMNANGIKAPRKRPTQGVPTAVPAAATIAASRPRRPKLADVIEEKPTRGCCFSLCFGTASSSDGGRDGAAAATAVTVATGGSGPPAVAGAIRSSDDSGTLPAPTNRSLTVSGSGRGAPSVTMSSFRQANQSIKRVPQSARSRGVSAASRAQSAAASNDADTVSNWDEEGSDGEFEDLEDFNNDDLEAFRTDNNGANARNESRKSAGGSKSTSRTTSRATSAAVAYAAGSKTAPKSILKSAKRVGSATTSVGFSASESGQAPANPADSYNGVYSVGAQGLPAYGVAAPPGFTSTSRVNMSVPPPLPSLPDAGSVPGGDDLGGARSGAGEWLLAGGQVGGSAAVYAGGSGAAGGAAGMLRTGASSLKLTAEELLGLLVAQGKLTEHDVHELGLASGAERNSPGGGGGNGGSSDSGSSVGPSQGGAVGQAVLPGGASGASGPGRSSGMGSDTGVIPTAAGLHSSETGSAVQQRVRFGAPQVVQTSSISTAEIGPREVLPTTQQTLDSTSHRVRFGGDEQICESGRGFGATALILPASSAAGAGTAGSTAGLLDIVRGSAVTEEAEASTPARTSGPHGQQPTHQANFRNCILESFDDRDRVQDKDGSPPAPLLPLPLPLPPSQSHRQQQTVAVGAVMGGAAAVAAMAGSIRFGNASGGRGGANGGGDRGTATATKRRASDLDSSLDLDEVLSTAARHLGGSQGGYVPETEPCQGSGGVVTAGNALHGSFLALPAPPVAMVSAAPAGGGTVGPGTSPANSTAARPEVEALRLAAPDLPFLRISGAGGGCGSYRSSDSGIGRLAGLTPRQGSRHSLGGDPGALLLAAAAAAAATATPPSPVARAPQAFRQTATSGLASRPGSAGSNTSVTAFGNWAPPPHYNGTAAAAPLPTNNTPLLSELLSGNCSSTSISESGFALHGGVVVGGGGGGGSAVAATSVSGMGRAAGAVWGSSSAGPPHTLVSSSSKGPSGQRIPEVTLAVPRPGMGAVDLLALRKLQSHLWRSGGARASPTNVEEQLLRSPPVSQPGPSRATWCDTGGGYEESDGQDGDHHQLRLASGGADDVGGGGGGGRSVRFTSPMAFKVDADADDSDDDDDAGRTGGTEGGAGWRNGTAAAAAAVAAATGSSSGRHRSHVQTARSGDRAGTLQGAEGHWL